MKNNKSKNKRVPKYEFGTLIDNPQSDLMANEIAWAKAAKKASNNGWVKGLKTFGNLAQQVGTSMMQKGMANGEGADGKGIAGFLNNNYGNVSGGINMLPGFANQGGFAFGGDVPGLTPVEVEGEEVGQTPDGQLLDFIGPSHEQGGINIALPPGTEMYSKRIKVDGVSMADRKKKRERKTLTLEQLFEKNSTDALLKNTLSKTKQNNEIEETADNQIQMLVKNMLEPPKQTHAYGNTVGDPTKDIKYAHGLNYDTFKPYFQQYNIIRKQSGLPVYNDFSSPEFQTDYSNYLNEKSPVKLKTADNIFGNNYKDSSAALFADKFDISGYDEMMNDNPADVSARSSIAGNPGTTGSNPMIDYGAINSYFGNLGISDDAHVSEVTNRPYPATPGINPDGEGDDEAGFKLGDIFGGMTFGDALGMAGNWYQSNKIMDTIRENRAGDTPNINAFENYGKEGLKTLDETKQYVNQVRDEFLKGLQLDRTSTIKRNRNSARGVNTQRALDLAADASINNTQEKSYSSFAEQMMSILSNEAAMKNQIDSVVMEGEQQKDLNDRKDRDNYYKQLITGHKNIGQTMSQTGKDLNTMKQRGVMENLINQLSMYGITVDESGNLSSKTTKKGK